MIDYSDYPPELAWLLREVEREINALFDDFEMGRLKALGGTLEIFQNRMASILTRFHTAAYMVGAKVKDLIVKDIQEIKNFVKVQLDFFENFVKQIKDAVEPLWSNWRYRAIRYGEAIRTLYWKGKTRGIPLPSQPGEGTFCHCGCFWDIVTLDEEKGDHDAFWKRGKNDSCEICIERERTWNPVRIRDGELTGNFNVPFIAKEFQSELERLLYA